MDMFGTFVDPGEDWKDFGTVIGIDLGTTYSW
jgi:molecular chaperone DnaK (HSP70)